MAIAAEIHGRVLWSRLLRVLDNQSESAAVMAVAGQLSQAHLDPATAKLPRLTPGARSVQGRKVIVEAISKYPPLFRVSGLLNGAECASIRATATPLLEPSGVHIQGGGQGEGFRTSSTAWVKTADNKVLRGLTERVASLLGLPLSGLLDGLSSDSGKVQVVHCT